jgi:hypothetical protein
MATGVANFARNSFALLEETACHFQIAPLTRQIATLGECTGLAVSVTRCAEKARPTRQNSALLLPSHGAQRHIPQPD